MKFITEYDLRTQFNAQPFTDYKLDADCRLTPSARQFLSDRNVKLIGDDVEMNFGQPTGDPEDTGYQAQPEAAAGPAQPAQNAAESGTEEGTAQPTAPPTPSPDDVADQRASSIAEALKSILGSPEAQSVMNEQEQPQPEPAVQSAPTPAAGTPAQATPIRDASGVGFMGSAAPVPGTPASTASGSGMTGPGMLGSGTPGPGTPAAQQTPATQTAQNVSYSLSYAKLINKIEILEAEFLMMTSQILTEDVEIAQEVSNVSRDLGCLKKVITGEAVEAPIAFTPCTGMNEENCCRDLGDCFELNEFYIQSPNGAIIVKLNLLRAMTREIRIMAVEALSVPGDEQKLITVECGVNRIINKISQLICKTVGVRECKKMK